QRRARYSSPAAPLAALATTLAGVSAPTAARSASKICCAKVARSVATSDAVAASVLWPVLGSTAGQGVSERLRVNRPSADLTARPVFASNSLPGGGGLARTAAVRAGKAIGGFWATPLKAPGFGVPFAMR